MSLPADLRAHARWARFPASCVSPRRLTEPPRTCGVWGRIWKGSNSFDSCWSLSHAVREKPARSFPPLAGRGGSVSRRDLNQATGNRAQLTGGTKPEEKYPAERQPLFGRAGSGGRGASLREAASPPRISRSSPTVSWEGSAREGASLQRSPLPRIHLSFYFVSYQFSPW